MSSGNCINCNVRLTRIRRHILMHESQAIIDTIRLWTYPREITQSDRICGACWELAAHQSSSDTIPTRRVGHQHVCVVCGRSILRISRRRIFIEEPNNFQQRMITIISGWIQPRELHPEDEACVPCWLRAQRASRSSIIEQQDNPLSLAPEQIDQEVPDTTCCLCGNIFSYEERPQTSQQERQILGIISNLLEQHQMPSINEVCSACWERAEGILNTQQSAHFENISEPQFITLENIRRAAETPRHCIFRPCTGSERHSTPDDTRRQVLRQFYFYIPRGARICTEHLQMNEYDSLYAAENSLDTFNCRYIEEIIFILTDSLNNINYENIQNYPEHQVQYFIGITKRQHASILETTPSLRNMHRGSFALTALLCKLRTGDSGDRLSILFQVPRTTLETLMSVARGLLLAHYVPQHLGFAHITREQVASKNLMLADGIFGEPDAPVELKPAITIADATYLYTQKSSNYMFQKDTYSLHKYRNLLKPFILCCCNGYIIDVRGPYSAVTNDATIMNNLLNDDGFNNFFRENDIFILDRGFRDCIDNLHEKGYLGFMPESREDGHSQLTTLQANRSRCVTINRWVVEAVNGRFKRDFKIFRHEYFNRACKNIMGDFKIAAALLNHFSVQYTNPENAQQYLEIIFDQLFKDNNIGRFVNEFNLNRRGSLFIPIDGTTIIFPRLSMQDLHLIACGVYQIRQARSYVGEHFRFHGVYTLEICQEHNMFQLEGINPMLVRARIKSRHSSAKTYFVFIVVERELNGREAVLSYCCNCIVGLRTVGCCSHIMSILWYLGYARHEGMTRPAPFLDDVVLRIL